MFRTIWSKQENLWSLSDREPQFNRTCTPLRICVLQNELEPPALVTSVFVINGSRMLLTLRNILLRNLNAAQICKKFPTFCGTTRFSTAITKPATGPCLELDDWPALRKCTCLYWRSQWPCGLRRTSATVCGV